MNNLNLLKNKGCCLYFNELHEIEDFTDKQITIIPGDTKIRIPINLNIKDALALKEMAAPNQTSGFGALYAGTDNELYYKDDGGNATKITSAGSLPTTQPS